jgi:phosphoglycerate dehydrogenase-like enzyme
MPQANVTAVLWVDDPQAYRDALAEAGLAERVTPLFVPRGEMPADDVLARGDITCGWPPPAGTFARMPKLQWVQTPSVGVGGWLRRKDLKPEIPIACARGIHRLQMPENILGALFHITKNYSKHEASKAEGKWKRMTSEPLAGKTLGILGLGTVGQELARKAAALEMRVIGTKRSPAPIANVEKVYPPEETDEILRQSDFVLLLLPDIAETDGFMNAARLAKMKPTAWLLNFSRGALIVDDDLIAAVKDKKIAGAILDAFREEPLPPEHPFWKAPGILVLPHIGGGHPKRDRIVADLFVKNLKAWFEGQPLTTQVDRAKGY